MTILGVLGVTTIVENLRIYKQIKIVLLYKTHNNMQTEISVPTNYLICY